MSERAHRPGDDTDALDVLRTIWTAQRRAGVGGEAPPPATTGTTKVCKNMKNIGFGGLGATGEMESTAVPVGDDQRTAWRARLAEEGKLRAGATSLRDLVIGDS